MHKLSNIKKLYNIICNILSLKHEKLFAFLSWAKTFLCLDIFIQIKSKFVYLYTLSNVWDQ